jgi:hypothetical protein
MMSNFELFVFLRCTLTYLIRKNIFTPEIERHLVTSNEPLIKSMSRIDFWYRALNLHVTSELRAA